MAQSADLVGTHFGQLTVMEKTDKTEDRYTVWRCKCQCGREILVNTKRLKRGTVQNCGCIPKKSRKLEAVSDEISDSTHRKRKKQGTPHNRMDITGRQFGRLTALYPTNQRDKKGSVYWHCRCICGKELEVTQNHLVHGRYKSCGCLKKKLQKEIQNQLHMIDGTCIEWLEKRKSRSDNTSGFRGVYLLKNGKYRVSIGFKKKQYYIGTYKDYEEAIKARLQAEELIHGGFVKAYYFWKEKCEQDPSWMQSHPFVFDIEKKDGQFHIITNKTK